MVQSAATLGVETGADVGHISAIVSRYNLRPPIEAGVVAERVPSTGESKLAAETVVRRFGLVGETSSAYLWVGASLNCLTAIMGNTEPNLALEWRAILPDVDRWSYENHIRQVSLHAEDLTRL